MLKIYNSLERKKVPFEPLREGEVGIYVCGPTVYDEPHIGHVRSAYVFDVIRRYLEYKGYKVKFVRNVTDIDDKIINKARKELGGEDLNMAVKKISDKYFESYRKCMYNLGIKPPSVEPKATEYIDKMKTFINALIEKGIAYEAQGSVYFDITKAKGYGKLSNQNTETLKASAGITQGENLPAGRQAKQNPLDFALWKKSKKDEPLWSSPWGEGRPAWHIECSVMSSCLLGDEFDIHGGGLDLIFPHHENEIAQSEGLGKKFARYWIHNGLLTINGQKMAKSLGNFVTVNELLEKYSADALKLLFLQTHYSHPVDFTWEKMEEVKSAYERIHALMVRLNSINDVQAASKDENILIEFRNMFSESMDDDFNTPKGLAILFDIVSRCHKFLKTGFQSNISTLSAARIVIWEILGIFGIDFGSLRKSGLPEEEINKKMELRKKYREDKNFQEADKIRKELDKKGIILEDGKEGTWWRPKI